MPRILTPRRETSKGSLPRRRGSANLSMHSLPGSRSSLQKYSRRSSANDQPPYGGSSKFSLRQSSLKRTESSSHSLSQRGLYRHQAEQEHISKNDKHNDVWNFEEPSVSQPPSLTSSRRKSTISPRRLNSSASASFGAYGASVTASIATCATSPSPTRASSRLRSTCCTSSRRCAQV